VLVTVAQITGQKAPARSPARRDTPYSSGRFVKITPRRPGEGAQLLQHTGVVMARRHQRRMIAISAVLRIPVELFITRAMVAIMDLHETSGPPGPSRRKLAAVLGGQSARLALSPRRGGHRSRCVLFLPADWKGGCLLPGFPSVQRQTVCAQVYVGSALADSCTCIRPAFSISQLVGLAQLIPSINNWILLLIALAVGHKRCWTFGTCHSSSSNTQLAGNRSLLREIVRIISVGDCR